MGNYLWCNLPVWCSCRTCINYSKGGQIAASGQMWPATAFSVTRGSIQEICSNMFRSEIQSKLSQWMFVLTLTLPRLASISFRMCGPPLNAAFSKWPLSQIKCPFLNYSIGQRCAIGLPDTFCRNTGHFFNSRRSKLHS